MAGLKTIQNESLERTYNTVTITRTQTSFASSKIHVSTIKQT